MLKVNTNSLESADSFEQEAYKDLSVPFYKFNSPTLFYDWAISTDEQAGGESRGSIAFNEKENYAEVKGQLVEERNNLLQQRMYVGLACDFLQRVNLKNYNGIRMRIKTDGNLYKLHISCNSDYDLLHDAYAFIISQTEEWQTVEGLFLLQPFLLFQQKIPFARFLVEKLKGQDSSKFMEHFIDEKFIMKGFSIVLESEEEKEFKFQIQSIDVSYLFNSFHKLVKHERMYGFSILQDFQYVTEKYKRPFFFLKQDSYKNLDSLDLGDQVLQMREDNMEQRSHKVTVNEVINPKEVKEFVSFKDRINQRKQN